VSRFWIQSVLHELSTRNCGDFRSADALVHHRLFPTPDRSFGRAAGYETPCCGHEPLQVLFCLGTIFLSLGLA
jgi:hypothetical protein